MLYPYCFFLRILYTRLILPVVVISLILFYPSVFGHTAENFPYLAESASDRVNVRAGQNTNFEKLCQLKKGEEVIVSGNSFGWYKIQLPVYSLVYVSDKYVARLDEIYGEILVDQVNVRAVDSTEATIVGRLKKGDRVRVLARKQGWYAIEPPEQVFGWVSQEFIKFKSMDIAHYQPREVPVLIEKLPEAISSVSNKISAVGYLKAVSINADGIFYELANETQSYNVQGPKSMLDQFSSICPSLLSSNASDSRCLVIIEGTVGSEQKNSSSQPQINVLKIQLVL